MVFSVAKNISGETGTAIICDKIIYKCVILSYIICNIVLTPSHDHNHSSISTNTTDAASDDVI